jgi:hypothetical protein
VTSPVPRENEFSPAARDRHDGGERAHGGEQQTEAERDGERRGVAMSDGAEHVGAGDADRHGGDGNRGRQRERGRGDQFDQRDGALRRRRRLLRLALACPPHDQSFHHVNLHESPRHLSRPMPAPVRPDLGEGFGE